MKSIITRCISGNTKNGVRVEYIGENLELKYCKFIIETTVFVARDERY
jgi:hypothetical protein